MDGKNLSRLVRQSINESSTSVWLDERTTYDYLYEAAKEWVRRTKCLTNTQSITTVADQTDYTIDGDYMGLYLRNAENKYYIKYNDGSDNYFPTFKGYSSIIYDDNDTSVAIPDNFSIADEQSLDSQISGTASADGDATGGKSLLTTTSDLSDVTSGDIVHNTTDDSDGVVVSVPSGGTTAYICLFDGTDNEWDSSDAFIIQPRRRFRLILDPPPETASETITFYYIQKPAPVYSDYDVYNIAFEYSEALAKYAVWLYKYRDREPQFGDAFYQYWERAIRAYIGQTEDALHRTKFTVSFKRAK